MPTLRTATVIAILSAGALAACSSEEPPSAARSAGDAKRSMSAPSTTDLTRSNGVEAFETSKSQRAAGGMSPFGGAAPAGAGSIAQGLAIRSVRTLADDALDEGPACPDVEADKESGVCPCAGSGEMEYSVSDIGAIKRGALDGELSMAFVFKGCSLGGKKLDGKMTIVQSAERIIDKSQWTAGGGDAAPKAGSGGAAAGAPNMLWTAEGLSDGAETLDFSLLVQDGETCLRPEVDGGFYYVCIGSARVAVHAKNGSFVCDFDEGRCSGDAGAIALDGASGGGGGGGAEDGDEDDAALCCPDGGLLCDELDEEPCL